MPLGYDYYTTTLRVPRLLEVRVRLGERVEDPLPDEALLHAQAHELVRVHEARRVLQV